MKTRKYSFTERRQLLAKLSNRSGSVADFARREGDSVGTLYKWQGELEEVPDKIGAFKELLPVREEESVGYRFEVKGRVVRVDPLPPVEWMGELLKQLGI